jgi:hypothetical protein
MPFTAKFTYNGPTSISVQLPSATVTLGTEDIDALILQLAKFRAQMTPKIERTLKDGEHGLGIVDPLWQLHPTIDHKILFVRHDGFGWMSFLFPHQEAKKLGNGFCAETVHTDPQAPTGRPH